MASEHESIIRAQYQQLEADRAQAYADLGRGASEDQYTTMEAGNRILEADTKRAALDTPQQIRCLQQRPWATSFADRDEMDIVNGIAAAIRPSPTKSVKGVCA